MVFNKPWMDNINNNLLLRYWARNSSKLPLITRTHGINFVHRKTDHGILTTVTNPITDCKNVAFLNDGNVTCYVET